MRLGLAQIKFPHSAVEGIRVVKQMMKEAAEKQCEIICFPESVIPGLRGVGYVVESYQHEVQEAALKEISAIAKQLKIAVILPMEWKDELGMHIVAFVISEEGEILGYQTKNQIDPEEDQFDYLPGEGRQLFTIKNVKFGIVICHEGWRYPETVRSAAMRDAKIVFHPQFTGEVENPDFFNHAMICRSLENNIYFASVNYALKNQQSTTSLISPAGKCLIKAKPDNKELLVIDIEPSNATGLLAKRFKPSLV